MSTRVKRASKEAGFKIIMSGLVKDFTNGRGYYVEFRSVILRKRIELARRSLGKCGKILSRLGAM